jgi:hypothetical protein
MLKSNTHAILLYGYNKEALFVIALIFHIAAVRRNWRSNPLVRTAALSEAQWQWFGYGCYIRLRLGVSVGTMIYGSLVYGSRDNLTPSGRINLSSAWPVLSLAFWLVAVWVPPLQTKGTYRGRLLGGFLGVGKLQYPSNGDGLPNVD